MATTEVVTSATSESEGSRTRFFVITIVVLAVVGIAISAAAYWFYGVSGSKGDLSAISAGDTGWVLAAAALVMIMTPAVGFFYGGMVGKKNVVSLIKQSVLILGIVSIQWVLVGYSLAFGPDAGGLGIIGSLDFFALRGVGFAPGAYGSTIPQLAFVMFQAMFAIVTPALIIGSFIGRIKFRTLVVFVILWSTLVYDPVAHWVWNADGWLAKLGALDFAGGTVVHMTAGFAGLASALVIGRRKDHKPGEPLPSNNVPFVLLGAALLWFGWFGFNPGSALQANGLAASAFVVTNTAAAAAGLTWMILSWAENKKPSAMATATGAVVGLVAITPASGFVGPVASIAIGIIAGIITYGVMFIRSKKTRIDDTLDVFAAHGMGGLVGALLTGVFAETAINAAGHNGVLWGNYGQLGIQALAALASLVWSFGVTSILLLLLKPMKLRVSEEEEEQGLDVAVHGEEGYRL